MRSRYTSEQLDDFRRVLAEALDESIQRGVHVSADLLAVRLFRAVEAGVENIAELKAQMLGEESAAGVAPKAE